MTSRAVEFTRRIAVGLGGWSLPNLTVTPLRRGSRTGGNRRGESRQCTMRTSREGDSPRCGGGLGRVSRVMPEETLVYWSARASGVAFFVATLLAGSWTCGRVSTAVVRGAWTIACVLLVAHELLAMGLAFGWSQTLAWQNIAAQTLAATGVDSGGGLIVNYAAGVLWSADVAWWWLRPRSYFAAGVDHGCIMDISCSDVLLRRGGVRGGCNPYDCGADVCPRGAVARILRYEATCRVLCEHLN